MAHPRIEEVEDSDVEMSDPSEGDIDDFTEADIMRPRNAAPFPSSSFSSSKPAAAPATGPRSHLIDPSNIPAGSGANKTFNGYQTTDNTKAYAAFQCLYPVYFDASRSRADGRRVSKDLAVHNPLAREIVNACRDLRISTLFEPEKLHPKDWANPGRVKIQLKDPQTGRNITPGGSVKNKHHLYILIAQHLRKHPTTDKSPALWERVPLPGAGQPDPSKPYPRPAVPRGWKMGELLPHYSPAMTGGGVSKDLFKDMMKEMQGGGDMASMLAGAAGSAGGGGGGGGAIEETKKNKKDKKGKGKA